MTEIYKLKPGYDNLLKTGYFFEIYPDFTGKWDVDYNEYAQRRMKCI